MKISVSNILGKTIEIPIEKQSNNNAIFDTEMLPSGVYIITVTDKFGKSTMQKLIKV
jgi:hypothetical protein